MYFCIYFGIICAGHLLKLVFFQVYTANYMLCYPPQSTQSSSSVPHSLLFISLPPPLVWTIHWIAAYVQKPMIPYYYLTPYNPFDLSMNINLSTNKKDQSFKRVIRLLYNDSNSSDCNQTNNVIFENIQLDIFVMRLM